MPSTPILIRDAAPADHPTLHELSARAIQSPRQVYRPTQAAIEAKHARAASRRCLVASIDNQIVGYLEYEPRQDAFRLLGPMVDPSHRRRGVARALIEHLATLARSAGLARLSLATVDQTGNVPIFEKLGFRVVARGPVHDSESVTGAALTEAEMLRDLH